MCSLQEEQRDAWLSMGKGKFGDFVMSHILAVSFALVDLRQ